jgi:Protein of unknown function (DUF2778)
MPMAFAASACRGHGRKRLFRGHEISNLNDSNKPREVGSQADVTFVNHAQHPPALNPHLTKSRLNGAPRLCEMLLGNFPLIIARKAAFDVRGMRSIERSLEGERGGTSLDPSRMSYSTSACVHVAVSKPRRSSRKSISPGFFGCAAVGGLVLACAWTVHANIIRADVYPTLGIANYDAPVIRLAEVVVRKSPPAENALRTSAREMAPSAPSLSFNDRFAAAAPQSVQPKPQPQPPTIAEAPKPQVETPKLATAPKAKEAASLPVQVASIPASSQHPLEARPPISPGSAVRDMAQRAKAALIALATSEKQSIVEKLWGKQQPLHGPLLAFASADASVTGSLGGGIGQSQNPALGGSAPYDRSTAVYDISARTVYLPDGTQLEAHSGLGSRLDDPRSAHVKMHGVTPPHIYELKPREALFHGVPALRMTPVGGEEAIFGRSGLLAHSFMLGPNGDSNGCVSFRDYDAFLNAYRNQGIKRLAVVAKVE